MFVKVNIICIGIYLFFCCLFIIVMLIVFWFICKVGVECFFVKFWFWCCVFMMLFLLVVLFNINIFIFWLGRCLDGNLVFGVVFFGILM